MVYSSIKRLKITRGWEKAVGKALRKERPREGWPVVKEPK